MHVLIIPSWYPADSLDTAGCFFRDQAIALHNVGCKVGVIYHQHHSIRMIGDVLKTIGKIRYEDDHGVVTYRYDGVNWFPRLKDISIKYWVRNGMKIFRSYVRKHGKPDLVHVHSILYAGLFAEAIRKEDNIPFVVTEHSSAYARNMLNHDDIDTVKRICNSAGALLAVSDEFCTYLDRVIKNSKKWLCVPNMVGEDFLLHCGSLEKGRKFNFINIATMDENKNQRIIIDAFSQYFNKTDNVNLILGGEGALLKSLVQYAKDLHVDDRVEFTGLLSREQVISKLSESSVFVLSSRYETFGVVVIESFALGLPVVATRCGGPNSLIQKDNGILVPIDDVESLGLAMRDIYINYDHYDRNLIREYCVQRFSANVVVGRLIEIYANICVN
jgi:glycosyltransferase involved in cell wall biosynthesis